MNLHLASPNDRQLLRFGQLQYQDRATCTTQPRQRTALADVTQRLNNSLPLAQAFPRKGPSFATDISPDDIHIVKKAKTQDLSDKDLKTILINYFSDGQLGNLKDVCKKYHRNSYRKVNRYINKDKPLREAVEHRNRIEIRKCALTRINQLFPVKIDTSANPCASCETQCNGMNLPELARLADINHDIVYNNWTYNNASKTWHSNNCHRSCPLTTGTMEAFGWKFCQEVAQCPSCCDARRNALRRHSEKFRQISRNRTIEGSLKREVNDAYCNHVESHIDKEEGIKNLKTDEDFVKSMKMLAEANVTEVKCDDGKASCRMCVNKDCGEMLVTRARLNNSNTCRKCQWKAYNAEQSNKRREKNYYKQMASDSNTNLKYLTEEQKIGRIENIRDKYVKLEKDNLHLKQENTTLKARLSDGLSKKVDLLGEEGRNADDFLSCCEFMVDTLLSDERGLRANLKELMNGVMNGILKKDAKNPGRTRKHKVGHAEKSADELVDTVVEAMLNTSLELNGRSDQCSYSPVIFQVAQAVWSTSPAAYKDLCNLLPFSIPGKRQLQRNAKEAHTKDGRTPKPYQQRLATKHSRGKSREVGYLQCDEMKLKHGIYWNTQTGEAVGLADDMLDMDSIIRRILSDDGDVPKAAVSVNQWQYVSFGTNGLETWFCEHFFNDGFLTGATLARQYNQVLRSCEAIESEVYGLVMDAGGNNSRFVRDILDKLKIMKHDPWLGEEHCVATNVAAESKRKVHFWFCSTHVLKAVRGQLFASRPSGKKAFKSANGEAFGWLPAKLLEWLEADKAKTGGKVSQRVRLNNKSANPKNQLKMSVHLAKVPFEHNTITYAITKFSEILGITPGVLEEATNEARMNHPFRRLISQTERGEEGDSDNSENEEGDGDNSETAPIHGSNLRHCHNLEKILYLQRVAREKEGKSPETIVEGDFEIDDKEEDDEFGDQAFGERYDEFRPDNDDADCWDDVSSSREQQCDMTSTLLGDLASLVFMGHVEALFHNFILNKDEKLTARNIDIYEKHAKDLMKYFGVWKLSQLKQKAQKSPDWPKMMMAHQTYRNIRQCLSGFFYFSRYMLNEVFPGMDGLAYIPMLCANQSSLEGKFSSQRRTGHDSGRTYSKGVSTKSDKRSKYDLGDRGYDANDCLPVARDTNVKEVGLSRFKAHFVVADNKLSELKRQREETNKEQNNDLPSRFGLEKKENNGRGGEKGKIELDCKYEWSKDVALALNARLLKSHYADMILNSASFEEFIKLCHKKESTANWLKCFIACDDIKFNTICQKVSLRLFGFWEDATFGDSSCPSFEQAILKFCLSSDFENVYQSELPETLRGNKLGAIYIIDALHGIFEEWISIILRQIEHSRGGKPEIVLTIDSDGMKAQMHRMVGAAIPKAIDKFCPAERQDEPVFRLLKSLSIKHKDALNDAEYLANWYPDALRNENMGNLHLINPRFVEWASKISVFSVNFFNKRNLTMYRRNAISVGREQLYQIPNLFGVFKQAILANTDLCLLKIEEAKLEQLHRQLITCAFNAYSGFKWKDIFDKIKDDSDDKTNLPIRTLIQTTGSADGSTSRISSTSTSKKKKPRKKKISTASMIAGRKYSAACAATSNSLSNSVVTPSSGKTQLGTKQKKRRVTEIDFKEDYDNCAQEALIKLKDVGHDAKKAVLDQNQCCAVLWVCFRQFHKSTAMKKVGESRSLLQAQINESNIPFSAAAHLERLAAAAPEIGRFTHLENTLPPHKILKDEDAMDTDEYGTKTRLPAHTGQESEDIYDNDVTEFSQALY